MTTNHTATNDTAPALTGTCKYCAGDIRQLDQAGAEQVNQLHPADADGEPVAVAGDWITGQAGIRCPEADSHAPDRTATLLGAAVEAELDAEYTLVYAEQGQRLPEDMVAAIVRGDNDLETSGAEDLAKWEGEVSLTAAEEAVDELAKQIVTRWEAEDSPVDTTDVDADYSELIENEWPVSDERAAAVDTVRERDRSTWYTDLLKAHGPVLLRVGIATMDEDASLSYTPMSAEQFLDLLGFEHTSHNTGVAEEIIGNASPECSVAMGYALVGVDLDTIAALPQEPDAQIEIRNPHVWLGSPFSGSGWCGDEPLHGTLTVHRQDLRTDKDAFGYSWDEVVGGTHASYYKGEVVAAPTTRTATDDDTTR